MAPVYGRASLLYDCSMPQPTIDRLEGRAGEERGYITYKNRCTYFILASYCTVLHVNMGQFEAQGYDVPEVDHLVGSPAARSRPLPTTPG